MGFQIIGANLALVSVIAVLQWWQHARSDAELHVARTFKTSVNQWPLTVEIRRLSWNGCVGH